MDPKTKTWLLDQIVKRGLFKVVALMWVMLLVSVLLVWFMIQPEKLAWMSMTIGLGIIGLVGTVLAVAFRSNKSD